MIGSGPAATGSALALAIGVGAGLAASGGLMDGVGPGGAQATSVAAMAAASRRLAAERPIFKGVFMLSRLFAGAFRLTLFPN